jgi:hypothetical protein
MRRTASLLLLACGNLLELLFGHNDPELFVALALAGRTRPLPSVNGVPCGSGHVAIALGNVLLVLLEPVVLPLFVPLTDLYCRIINGLLDPNNKARSTMGREDDVVPRLGVASLRPQFFGRLNKIAERRAVVGHALLLHKSSRLRLGLDAIPSRRIDHILGCPRYGRCRAGRAAVVENAALFHVIELRLDLKLHVIPSSVVAP